MDDNSTIDDCCESSKIDRKNRTIEMLYVTSASVMIGGLLPFVFPELFNEKEIYENLNTYGVLAASYVLLSPISVYVHSKLFPDMYPD